MMKATSIKYSKNTEYYSVSFQEKTFETLKSGKESNATILSDFGKSLRTFGTSLLLQTNFHFLTA